MKARIVRIDEYQLTFQQKNDLRNLLDNCFSDTFEGRIFYKQLPHFRYLAYTENNLIGQIGVDHRVIRVGDIVLPIFGLIDLCVFPQYRSNGIGAKLLNETFSLAKSTGVKFNILMADNHTLYKKEGYCSVKPAQIRWQAIDDLNSIETINCDLSDCFMIKSIDETRWPAGNIDMLGYLF